VDSTLRKRATHFSAPLHARLIHRRHSREIDVLDGGVQRAQIRRDAYGRLVLINFATGCSRTHSDVHPRHVSFYEIYDNGRRSNSYRDFHPTAHARDPLNRAS